MVAFARKRGALPLKMIACAYKRLEITSARNLRCRGLKKIASARKRRKMIPSARHARCRNLEIVASVCVALR